MSRIKKNLQTKSYGVLDLNILSTRAILSQTDAKHNMATDSRETVIFNSKRDWGKIRRRYTDKV